MVSGNPWSSKAGRAHTLIPQGPAVLEEQVFQSNDIPLWCGNTSQVNGRWKLGWAGQDGEGTQLDYWVSPRCQTLLGAFPLVTLTTSHLINENGGSGTQTTPKCILLPSPIPEHLVGGSRQWVESWRRKTKQVGGRGRGRTDTSHGLGSSACLSDKPQAKCYFGKQII